MAKKELELRVIASSLEGGGDAKMCKDDMDYLGLDDGDEVEVTRGKYSVVLNVHEDLIYAPESIRMRAEDIFLVGAREGDLVTAFLPEPITLPIRREEYKPRKKSADKKQKKSKGSKKRRKKK